MLRRVVQDMHEIDELLFERRASQVDVSPQQGRQQSTQSTGVEQSHDQEMLSMLEQVECESPTSMLYATDVAVTTDYGRGGAASDSQNYAPLTLSRCYEVLIAVVLRYIDRIGLRADALAERLVEPAATTPFSSRLRSIFPSTDRTNNAEANAVFAAMSPSIANKYGLAERLRINFLDLHRIHTLAYVTQATEQIRISIAVTQATVPEDIRNRLHQALDQLFPLLGIAIAHVERESGIRWAENSFRSQMEGEQVLNTMLDLARRGDAELQIFDHIRETATAFMSAVRYVAEVACSGTCANVPSSQQRQVSASAGRDDEPTHRTNDEPRSSSSHLLGVGSRGLLQDHERGEADDASSSTSQSSGESFGIPNTGGSISRHATSPDEEELHAARSRTAAAAANAVTAFHRGANDLVERIAHNISALELTEDHVSGDATDNFLGRTVAVLLAAVEREADELGSRIWSAREEEDTARHRRDDRGRERRSESLFFSNTSPSASSSSSSSSESMNFDFVPIPNGMQGAYHAWLNKPGTVIALQEDGSGGDFLLQPSMVKEAIYVWLTKLLPPLLNRVAEQLFGESVFPSHLINNNEGGVGVEEAEAEQEPTVDNSRSETGHQAYRAPLEEAHQSSVQKDQVPAHLRSQQSPNAKGRDPDSEHHDRSHQEAVPLERCTGLNEEEASAGGGKSPWKSGKKSLQTIVGGSFTRCDSATQAQAQSRLLLPRLRSELKGTQQGPYFRGSKIEEQQQASPSSSRQDVVVDPKRSADMVALESAMKELTIEEDARGPFTTSRRADQGQDEPKADEAGMPLPGRSLPAQTGQASRDPMVSCQQYPGGWIKRAAMSDFFLRSHLLELSESKRSVSISDIFGPMCINAQGRTLHGQQAYSVVSDQTRRNADGSPGRTVKNVIAFRGINLRPQHQQIAHAHAFSMATVARRYTPKESEQWVHTFPREDDAGVIRWDLFGTRSKDVRRRVTRLKRGLEGTVGVRLDWSDVCMDKALAEQHASHYPDHMFHSIESPQLRIPGMVHPLKLTSRTWCQPTARELSLCEYIYFRRFGAYYPLSGEQSGAGFFRHLCLLGERSGFTVRSNGSNTNTVVVGEERAMTQGRGPTQERESGESSMGGQEGQESRHEQGLDQQGSASERRVVELETSVITSSGAPETNHAAVQSSSGNLPTAIATTSIGSQTEDNPTVVDDLLRRHEQEHDVDNMFPREVTEATPDFEPLPNPGNGPAFENPLTAFLRRIRDAGMVPQHHRSFGVYLPPVNPFTPSLNLPEAEGAGDFLRDEAAFRTAGCETGTRALAFRRLARRRLVAFLRRKFPKLCAPGSTANATMWEGVDPDFLPDVSASQLSPNLSEQDLDDLAASLQHARTEFYDQLKTIGDLYAFVLLDFHWPSTAETAAEERLEVLQDQLNYVIRFLYHTHEEAAEPDY
ncbi:unnamed protein product [Amoebophrya sp. A25]|nr:unnamed protein product [Amoebophrya sp. A25]|eukprot:GSA25T00024332001.1